MIGHWETGLKADFSTPIHGLPDRLQEKIDPIPGLVCVDRGEGGAPVPGPRVQARALALQIERG
jgi:hypothetical protein